MNGGQLREFHKLVNGIMLHAEEPSMWPLTDEDRIAFLRMTIYGARKIRNTKLFHLQEAEFAATDLDNLTRKAK